MPRYASRDAIHRGIKPLLQFDPKSRYFVTGGGAGTLAGAGLPAAERCQK
jgi:hypothetical protein